MGVGGDVKSDFTLCPGPVTYLAKLAIARKQYFALNREQGQEAISTMTRSAVVW